MLLYVIYYLYIYICLIKINRQTDTNYMCLSFFLLITKKIVYINQITMLNYSSKQNKQIYTSNSFILINKFICK